MYNREKLKDGQRVFFDCGFGYSGEGEIIGLTMDHIYRFYIIKPDVSPDPTIYPYRCFALIETLIKVIE